jgi:hypothetical protein
LLGRAVDKPVQEPVFQFDRGQFRAVSAELYLDLAGVVGLGIELP